MTIHFRNAAGQPAATGDTISLSQAEAAFNSLDGDASATSVMAPAGIPRLASARAADIANIMDFNGADPSGNNSSLGALQAAMNQATAVFIPGQDAASGRGFVLDGYATAVDTDLAIYGVGSRRSRLLCYGASAGIVYRNPSRSVGDERSFQARGVGFVADRVSSCALDLEWGVVPFALRPLVDLEDVRVDLKTITDASAYWVKAVRVANATLGTFSRVRACNNTASIPAGSTGISFEGFNLFHNLLSCHFANADFSINVTPLAVVKLTVTGSPTLSAGSLIGDIVTNAIGTIIAQTAPNKVIVYPFPGSAAFSAGHATNYGGVSITAVSSNYWTPESIGAWGCEAINTNVGFRGDMGATCAKPALNLGWHGGHIQSTAFSVYGSGWQDSQIAGLVSYPGNGTSVDLTGTAGTHIDRLTSEGASNGGGTGVSFHTWSNPDFQGGSNISVRGSLLSGLAYGVVTTTAGIQGTIDGCRFSSCGTDYSIADMSAFGLTVRGCDNSASGPLPSLVGPSQIHAQPAAPATNPPSGSAILYVDPITGKLSVRGASGTVTVLAVP